MTDIETENKELRLIVKKLGDISDKISQELNIVQPFFSIWKEHGHLIEQCRSNPERKPVDFS